jgi:hypothetical protein
MSSRLPFVYAYSNCRLGRAGDEVLESLDHMYEGIQKTWREMILGNCTYLTVWWNTKHFEQSELDDMYVLIVINP